MLGHGGFGLIAQALREPSGVSFTSTMAMKMAKNGKKVLQKIFSRQRVKVPESKVPPKQQHNGELVLKSTLPPGYQNGSFFNQFVYRSYFKSLASELRRRAAFQFQRNGSQLPIFAFVGLAMAQNTRNENRDEVSSDIRNIFSEKEPAAPSLLDSIQQLSLDVFDFGGVIGKGCNAVVYEAKLKPQELKDDITNTVSESDCESDMSIVSQPDEGEVTEEFDVISSSLPEVDDVDESFTNHIEVMEDEFVTILKGEINNYENEATEKNFAVTETDSETNMYNLGIKMMFNYDVESKAESIYRAMQKETVPARFPGIHGKVDDWQIGNRVRLKRLPPHPNIVDMVGVFVAPVPVLDKAQEVYPAALPKRISEDGFGRNMTMFVVMKKYSKTLRQYLQETKPSIQIKCMLLAQLLEGILHLQNHKIAHRDLKSDNILINDTGDQVELVICDFGCCLAEENLGLKVPYLTCDTDKGGNTALMAPEIASAKPGIDVWLDYTKSDLWAVGTLVYELFGTDNPFYRSQGSDQRLDSRTYKETDLPLLPDDVPEPIKRLTYWLLKREPKERPLPQEAANIVQMYLSFSDWLIPGAKPSFLDTAESLLVFGAEAMMKRSTRTRRSGSTKDKVALTFLRRIDLSKVYSSLDRYHKAINLSLI